jgi:hypothetical protein
MVVEAEFSRCKNAQGLYFKKLLTLLNDEEVQCLVLEQLAGEVM